MGFTVHFNERINEKVLAGHIFVLRETEATHLRMENGAVTGVEVKQKDGTSQQFQAKSVILTTGGYAHNSELLHKGFTRVGSSTVSQADGSGFTMAQEAGAALLNMDYRCRNRQRFRLWKNRRSDSF